MTGLCFRGRTENKYGSMGVWEYGSMGVWEYETYNLNYFLRITP